MTGGNPTSPAPSRLPPDSGPPLVRLWIEGDPAPQGSKRVMGRPGQRAILVESSKKVAPWRKAVSAAVLAARGGETLGIVPTEPLEKSRPLRAVWRFYLRRGATVRREWPTTYPDVSKLVRAIEDALVLAGVLVDDSSIVAMSAEKRYADDREPGVEVEIRDTPTV